MKKAVIVWLCIAMGGWTLVYAMAIRGNADFLRLDTNIYNGEWIINDMTTASCLTSYFFLPAIAIEARMQGTTFHWASRSNAEYIRNVVGWGALGSG